MTPNYRMHAKEQLPPQTSDGDGLSDDQTEQRAVHCWPFVDSDDLPNFASL